MVPVSLHGGVSHLCLFYSVGRVSGCAHVVKVHAVRMVEVEVAIWFRRARSVAYQYSLQQLCAVGLHLLFRCRWTDQCFQIVHLLR
jgi:hypothetical protein